MGFGPVLANFNFLSHLSAKGRGLQHLNTYGLNLPEKFAATFFVVSLYGNPHDPLSYHNFISNFKFSEATTLIATIADLRSFYRSSDLGQDAISSMPSIESALATGHLIKLCWAPGGGDYRPEGMGKSKKKKPKGKKGKEKAHVAEEGGSTSQLNISSTHVVANSMSHQYNSEFSAYLSVSESYSKPSPSVPPPVVIDTGSTTHIHSVKSDFSHLRSISQHVTGFGNGSRKIAGRGIATFIAHLPPVAV
ncbi:hypothetical protein C8R42DRAFT_726899 [Lentinula raphanica]|nr:hypothetical protein C8R42DRAFT_726899 [Lentinula raphanica]